MKYYTRIGEREWEVEFERQDGKLLAKVGDRSYSLDLSIIGDGTAFSLLVNNKSHDLLVENSAGGTLVQMGGDLFKVLVEDERERTASAVASAKGGGKQSITALMPGVVVDVMVEVGDVVEEGQTLVILEAMKMQNPIQAEAPGKVSRVLAEKGAVVAGGVLLVELESATD